MKTQVYREDTPIGRFWRYEMLVRGKRLTGLRRTWREAMDAVARQRELIASGWRP